MIPRVHWSVDGEGVYFEDDWRATTIANGGYNTFSGKVKESVARRLNFDQGVVIRGYLDSGRPIWEGKTAASPTLQDGYASIQANGHKATLEKSHRRLLFQSRNIGWTDEASAPFVGTPSASISASSGPGYMMWEVAQGQTVATNDAHALVAWVPESHIRSVEGTLTIQGTSTNYTLKVYRFTGPNGARTVQTTPGFVAGLWNAPITDPEDAVAIALTYTGGGETRAGALRVVLSDHQVFDFGAGSMEASDVVSFVGKRSGFDVAGILSGGPGVDPATFMGGIIISAPGEDGFLPEPGVSTSAFDVMPLDWNGGSWAALLDYVAMMLDWRWRVLSNAGRGPVLQFGPWANMWNVSLASNARHSFSSQETFNEVVVRYTNAAGRPIQLTATEETADDAFAPNVLTETLADVQPDATLATQVATNLLRRAILPRKSGRIDIVGAMDASGKGTCYDPIAGDVVNLQDLGMAESFTGRITETEMSTAGTSLGIEDHVSVASQIAALVQQRRLRKPFGVNELLRAR